MKIYLYFFVILFLLQGSTTFAQTNCQTAIQNEWPDVMDLPAMGTIAPTGPDYGCLSILSRPVWGYFISCDSTLIQPVFDIDQPWGFPYFGIVIWGPFHDKSFACNNLTASNIFFCDDSITYQGIPFTTNYWNALPGELYYFMLTSTDTFPTNEIITSHYIAQTASTSGWSDSCFVCNNEVSLMLRRNVCLITNDSASQKTKLIWEKTPDAGIDGYIIHRGTPGSSVMDSVGYVSESLSGEFIDSGSSPTQFAETYLIQPVDSCGHSNHIGLYYTATAGFLQTFPAGNNTVNLNWNNFGAPFANYYESVQYIHRGSSLQTMQIIDTIPVAVLNYTDITAPAGQQYYSVERRRLSPCDPLRIASGTSFLSSMCNTSTVSVTGLPVVQNDKLITINPVPVTNMLHLVVNNVLDGNKLTIVDGNGKAKITKLINQKENSIDVSELPSGTYWVVIQGNTKSVKKILISR